MVGVGPWKGLVDTRSHEHFQMKEIPAYTRRSAQSSFCAGICMSKIFNPDLGVRKNLYVNNVLVHTDPEAKKTKQKILMIQLFLCPMACYRHDKRLEAVGNTISISSLAAGTCAWCGSWVLKVWLLNSKNPDKHWPGSCPQPWYRA